MDEQGEPSPTVAVKITRLPDLDRPLYRIFPLWFFDDALTVNAGRLVLVPPRVWEDPHEDISASIMMDAPDRSQKPLAGYLQPVYAQCWSFEGESDALLRAYSRVTKDVSTSRNVEPKYEGVQVRTTPQKIINALIAFVNKRRKMNSGRDPNFQFYFGAVEYVEDVGQRIVNRLGSVGPAIAGRGDDRADLLLLKRRAFQHEAEVRIVMVAPGGAKWDLFSVDIDPNQVFDEVQFDPRLAPFEMTERKDRARALGYKGQFGESQLYQKVLWQVPLPKHWDDYPPEPDPTP